MFEEHQGPKARRQKAAERTSFRAKRSPLEQRDLLDKRLGTAKGAEKERARLVKQIGRGS